MHLSIRARMILAMNLLVAAVGLAVGYAAIQVATRHIEQRLIYESARNAADLIGRERWPLDSDALMTQVARILGGETASGPLEGRSIVSSSLPRAQRVELAGRLAGGAGPESVVLGGKTYRLGSAIVRRIPAAEPTQQQERRFYLLVPEQHVVAAQREVAGRIAMFTIAAVVIATVVGFWLSTSIARPVRRLADRMDRLAREEEALGATPPAAGAAGGDAPTSQMPRHPDAWASASPSASGSNGVAQVVADLTDASSARPGRGPSETVRLMRSFDELLARLSAARQQLARAARLAALGELAASVAHELRNPLSGIKMNARVLADELAQAGKADESLNLIIREIDRMDLYLEELLSLASAPPGAGGASGSQAQPSGWLGISDAAPGAAAAPIPRTPVRLGELAESVLALLAGRCRHAGVTVTGDYAPAAPPALAEPARLRQVVLNLLLNALDAMPHGGRLSLAVRPTDGGGVRLEVADTGSGVQVPPGADIFEPFVTTKRRGTGLGLYICRRTIEALGGRIGYRSTPSGSTFWFELPAAAGA